MNVSEVANEDWMSALSSVDFKVITSAFLTTFVNELKLANTRLSFDRSMFGTREFLVSLFIFFSVLAVESFSSYILSRHKKAFVTMVIAEVLSLSMVLLAFFVPTSPLKLFNGLVFFASGLSLHSRICAQMQGKGDVVDEKRPDKFQDRFFYELFNTFYFNLLTRIHTFRQCRFPPILRSMHGLLLVVLIDTCTFLIREWIPDTHNVSAANQNLCAAVVGGVWVLFCMEFMYGCASSQFDMFGTPLPLEMRHRHPLLSESLNEFWGVRWNPIVGKLLQDSFYKPLRRLGVSRASCVVACFTGSAVLHAVPQYIATLSLSDCAMMFGFFFLQGVGLLCELIVQKLCGFAVVRTPAVKSLGSGTGSRTTKSESSKHSTSNAHTTDETKPRHNLKHQEALDYSICCKTAPYQFPAELLTLAFILSSIYVTLESLNGDPAVMSAAQKRLWTGVAVTCGAGASVLYYHIRRYIYREAAKAAAARALLAVVAIGVQQPSFKNADLTFSQFVGSFIGWLWVLFCIILLLPLFSIPVLHAVETLYAKSFIVGSFVRTVQKVVLPALVKGV